MRLRDKVAVVTGGADGIGRACSVRMAAEGARIVIADVNDVKGNETVKEIRSCGGEAIFIHCDVGSDRDMQSLIEKTVERFGRIDVLLNNAAVAIGSTITEMDEADWFKVININLSSVYRGCRYAIPHMLSNGGGSIINTSSVQAHVGFNGWTAYAAAKGGVIAMTRNMAVEFASRGIRFNTISPGTINTPMNVKILEETENAAALEEAWLSYHPLGRLGEPDEVAQTVVFLASDESSFITGEDIRVDGGLVVKP